MNASADVLRLGPEEAELVATEASHLASRLEADQARALAELAAAAALAEVPARLLPTLGALLISGLTSGRVRRLYLAEGERVARGLLGRTPAGTDLAEQVDSVNAALECLRGARLRHARAVLRSPGDLRLQLVTDTASLSLSLQPGSLSVESLEI